MRSNAELLLKIRRSTCEKEIPIEAAWSRDSKHRWASLVGRGLSGSTRRAPATKLVIDCDIGYLGGVAFGEVQAKTGDCASSRRLTEEATRMPKQDTNSNTPRLSAR